MRPAAGRPGAADSVLLLASVLSSVAFAIVRPPVSDLFAAWARESAARHHVGLGYWFSWFGGTVPGHYSVLVPSLTAAFGSVGVAAASAVLVVLLSWWALRSSSSPELGLLVVVVGVAANLWSGRVAFLAGSVFALLAVVAVQQVRLLVAAVAAVLATLVTPTCGAFLALGLVSVVLFDRRRRGVAVTAIIGALLPLLLVLVVFGSTGPEGFRVKDAVLATGAAVLLTVFPSPRTVRVTAALSVLVCLFAAVVPNGLGSNFQRFIWFVVPVLVVSSAQLAWRWAAVVAAGCALALALHVSIGDLRRAADPASSVASYDGVLARLASLDMRDLRVEAVYDGTRTASLALVGHAQLARGWETQSDKRYAAVLDSPHLDAASYRAWLDDNAVGWVLVAKHPLLRQAETQLVRNHRLPYLRLVWQDTRFELFAVADPTPIVGAARGSDGALAAEARVVAVTQASMTVRAPAAGTLLVRVRWSHLLRSSCGSVAEAPRGWTLLHTPRPCTAVLSARF